MVCPAVTRSSVSLSSPGVPASHRGPRDSAAQALGSFRAAGALRLGKGNFHRAWNPALRSAEPGVPSSSGVSAALSRPQLPSSLWGAKPAGGGGLYRTQLPAKRLRLSRSRPPRPEPSHLSGGGGWGAARPCSGSSCFFHHSEDARAGIAGSARRSAASDWPGRTLHTQQSARGPESAALPCRPAPGHRPVLAKEVSGQRKPPPLPPPPPRESGAREDAATRLPLRGAAATRSGQPLRGSCQPAPGWCAPPSVAAAPPLRRAALLLRPSRARPPPRVGLQPPPPWGLEMRDSIHGDAARAASRTAEAVTIRAHKAWARARGSERSGVGGSEKLGSLLAAARLSRIFLLSERVGDKV